MFKKISKRKVENLHNEFLPEALEIVEKPASPLGHLMIWITIGIFLVFIIWSICARIDVTDNARGKVVTTEGVKIVQAVNAGVVRKIYAKDGDKVKKGDKLILLDSDLEEAGVEYGKDNISLVKYKIELLSKVQKDIDISSDLKKTDNKDRQKIINYAQSLREERKATIDQYATELEKSKKQLQIEEKNYNVLLENEKTLQKQKKRLIQLSGEENVEKLKVDQLSEKITELEKEVKTYQTLYQSDAVTKEELDKKQKELAVAKQEKVIQQKLSDNTVLSQKKDLQNIEAQISEVKAKEETQKATIELEKKNVEAREESLGDAKIKSNSSISEIILDLNSQLKEMDLKLKQQNYNYENLEITAPITGTIQKIAVNTIGGVVTQAQALVEIIPNKSKLIVEADLATKDIGYVRVNQKASIKMDTYNYQEYGMLKGKVIKISPDAVVDEKKGPIYKVKIEVDIDSFKKKHEEKHIGTGMECTVEIKTGNRRIISFFLEPLMKHFDESLKVR